MPVSTQLRPIPLVAITSPRNRLHGFKDRAFARFHLAMAWASAPFAFAIRLVFGHQDNADAEDK